MIEIKSAFYGWQKVTKEQAKKIVLHIKSNATGIKPEEVIDYINKNKIRGITFEELMQDENN